MKFNRDYYLNKLIKTIGNKQVKIITGIRRCGKSYLLFELFNSYLKSINVSSDNIIKIELDRRTFHELRNPDKLCKYVLDKIKNKNKYFVFIDEIQMCDDFVSVLNEFLHINNLDVYVTGSNSKMLSKDILTSFRGRGCQIKVQPLSFKEFYLAGKYSDFEQAWKDYVVYGGMPYTLYLNNDNDKMNYLKDLFNETYIKDVKERCNIKSEKILSDLINILASSIGSFTNHLKIANTIKSVNKTTVSQNTLAKYIDILEDSFIINKSLKYDIKGKKYLTCPFKYYFSDIGLRNARLDFRQIEQTHLMENVVFNELINRGYSVDTGIVTINKNVGHNQYERKQLECDFVINKTNQKVYVQCCYQINDLNKFHQELKPLDCINDSFKKIIITKEDVNSFITTQGVEVISLKQFLLGKYLSDIEEKEDYSYPKINRLINQYK